MSFPCVCGRVAGALLATIPLSGCLTDSTITLPTTVKVKSADEAGAVLVSPTMVAPWADVSPALKPNFTMTGDTAVAQVIPTSETIQSQVLSAFGASLGIGLPGSSTQSSVGRTLNTATASNTAQGLTTDTSSANGTTTSTSTTTTTPGVAPTPSTGIPAGGQLPGVTAPAGGLSLDPILKYKGANYLNQEVQLLNQEIENAAGRSCFVPYAVKLKIAVMTYRPHLGYSVHSRVSFFYEGNGVPPIPSKVIEDAQTVLATRLAETKKISTDGALKTLQTEAAKTVEAQHIDAECLQSNHVPIVVPFLVADDLEVALKSQATEAAQQIALALSFMFQGVGANAGVNNIKQVLNAISSQDLSSSLTVARENDNTLYVHIEPKNQASGTPGLVGQTYDVAVLLLVPRRYFTWSGDAPAPANLSLITYTQFRDAATGEILPKRDDDHLAKSIDRIVKPYLEGASLANWEKKNSTEIIADAGDFVSAVQQADFDEFRGLFKGDKCSRETVLPCFPSEMAPALWTGLSAVTADNSYKTAIFQAPVPPKINVPLQTVLVADDSSSPVQAALSGVSGNSTASLAAHLELVVQPKDQKTIVVRVPAQNLSLDTTNHILNLTFPSIAKQGLSLAQPDPKKPPEEGSTPYIVTGDPRNGLAIEQIDCDPAKRLCPTLILPKDEAGKQKQLPLQFASAAKAEASPSLAIASTGGVVVVARDSTAALPVVIAVPKTGKLPDGESITLSVTGAGVVTASDASGGALGLGKGGYTLPKPGAYAFKLVNLIPGATVKISAQAMKKDGKPSGEPVTATYTAIPEQGGGQASK